MAVRPVAGRHVVWGVVVAVVLLWAAPALAETTVTLVNRQEGTVKIAVYNAGDVVQTIPLVTWNVNPGKSVDWDGAPATFHVKVFRPQLIDHLLASRNNVPRNTTVTIHADNSITFATKRSLRIRNASGERQIKVLIYNANDAVMLVPLATFHVGAGRTVTWPDAPRRFNVKVFRPQLIDHLLLLTRNLPDRKLLVFRGSGSSYRFEVRD
jgi:hypothetical protein